MIRDHALQLVTIQVVQHFIHSRDCGGGVAGSSPGQDPLVAQRIEIVTLRLRSVWLEVIWEKSRVGIRNQVVFGGHNEVSHLGS
jgi:hypothetical protein